MLTEVQVLLIRESAAELAKMEIPATNAFYANLFEVAPGVRELFPDDMFKQSEKLWQSIVMVVESADNPAEIAETLRTLGKRHVAYGAVPEHYPVVSEVLIETISKTMSDKWSDEYKSAWQAALTMVCDLMLEGARDVQS